MSLLLLGLFTLLETLMEALVVVLVVLDPQHLKFLHLTMILLVEIHLLAVMPIQRHHPHLQSRVMAGQKLPIDPPTHATRAIGCVEVAATLRHILNNRPPHKEIASLTTAGLLSSLELL
ncbi:unnamed protein product [Protopolystoma xenopodis]|uniref:Uncharacterized protein n=1 Tax=Protopolystoma xenopodis TaxID=117903 RepID=A0A3S5CDI4_9PLAT|nr:unnamed protein product [Protopolystoma xenopodis]